jgi:hypothetical protein
VISVGDRADAEQARTIHGWNSDGRVRRNAPAFAFESNAKSTATESDEIANFF